MVESVAKWRNKDRVADAPATVDTIAGKLGEQRSWVEDVLRDLRFVLDRFVADDCTVYAPPFLVRRQGDPVWVALRDLPDEGWETIKSFDDDYLAAVLGLDVTLVRRHPVVGQDDVLGDLWDLHGVLDEGNTQALPLAQRLGDVFYAWLELWDPKVDDYRTSRIGLERDFQKWLINDLDRLEPFGLPVELVREEFPFSDKLKADVLCRATADSDLVRRGDLVVIENKAHMVDVAACEQLRRYVERAKAEVAVPGEQVHGVLIADGRTLELQQQLYDEGFSYISLSALGYRDWLRGSPEAVTQAGEPDFTREATQITEHVPREQSSSTTLVPAASVEARRGPWVVAGTEYSDRSAANRALAAHLGTYTSSQWQEAQRQHGLR